ncbi:MAG TPA: hypothetical protein VKD91_06415 [Pyrinomonadaceae bacterium]|nr:hypothetical protein [Pyrinomonadaceae bacterium]
MIGHRTQLIPISHARQVRLLAALLLASIAWGATAEFTHNHGTRTRLPPAQTQAPTTFDINESVESTNSSNLSSRSNSAADCLICQLHQNLANTLLSGALPVAAVEHHLFGPNPDLVFHRADFSKSQRGRAPPTNL